MYSNYRLDVIDRVLGADRPPTGAVTVRRRRLR
jgi:hypothetical protein